MNWIFGVSAFVITKTNMEGSYVLALSFVPQSNKSYILAPVISKNFKIHCNILTKKTTIVSKATARLILDELARALGHFATDK